MKRAMIAKQGEFLHISEEYSSDGTTPNTWVERWAENKWQWLCCTTETFGEALASYSAKGWKLMMNKE